MKKVASPLPLGNLGFPSAPVSQAVRLFTINNAYGAFEENKKGSLELGKMADMVVLECDPFQVDAHAIANIPVLRTIVGGKDTYVV